MNQPADLSHVTIALNELAREHRIAAGVALVFMEDGRPMMARIGAFAGDPSLIASVLAQLQQKQGS